MASVDGTDLPNKLGQTQAVLENLWSCFFDDFKTLTHKKLTKNENAFVLIFLYQTVG